MHALTNLALGGQGFLSTEGAIAPKLCASVINYFAAGDQAATFAAFQRLMHLSAINVWPGGSVRYTKSALRALGQPGWHTRPPYLTLDESLDDQILQAIKALGILESRGSRAGLTAAAGRSPAAQVDQALQYGLTTPASMPPSARYSAPVQKLASSEARKRARLAISRGWPGRWMGTVS